MGYQTGSCLKALKDESKEHLNIKSVHYTVRFRHLLRYKSEACRFSSDLPQFLHLEQRHRSLLASRFVMLIPSKWSSEQLNLQVEFLMITHDAYYKKRGI